MNKNSVNKVTEKPSFRWLFSHWSQEAYILLLIPVLLTIWIYFGQQRHFTDFFGQVHSAHQDLFTTIYEYTTAFVLMFLVPFLIVRFGFKKKAKDFGFRIGDAKYGLRFALMGVPVILFFMYVGSLDPIVQAEYPLAKSTMGHWKLFLLVEFFYVVYYLGWEFFFRGFILFGLEKRIGPLLAILIQTIPSAIIHMGKPAGESFGAIAAGIVFGFLAIRTRSIFYPMILHASVGLGADYFSMLQILS